MMCMLCSMWAPVFPRLCRVFYLGYTFTSTCCKGAKIYAKQVLVFRRFY